MTLFIPNTNPRSEFSHFEISPKRQDPESNAQNIREVWTDEENPEFWGVYGRERLKDAPDSECGGPATWIADFETEGLALEFVRQINGSIKDYEIE